MSKHHHQSSSDADLDDAQRRAASTAKQVETGGRFKLTEGKTVFRILPTPADKERKSPAVYTEVRMHGNVGPKKRWLRCGIDPGERGGECWLCDKVQSLEEKGHTKRAVAMAAQEQAIMQIAVLDKDLGELTGPLRWELRIGKSPRALNYKAMAPLSSPKMKVYVDPKKGYNFTIKRTGMGRTDTEYGEAIRDDEPSRVPKGIMKQLKPFVDVLPQYDEARQQAAYYGKEEEDVAATKKSKKKKGKKEEEPSSSSSASSSSSSSASSSGSSSEPSSSSSGSSSEPSSSSSGSGSEASSSGSSSEPSSSGSGSEPSSSSSGSSSEPSSSSSSSSSASSSSSSSASGSSSGSDKKPAKKTSKKKPAKKPAKKKKR